MLMMWCDLIVNYSINYDNINNLIYRARIGSFIVLDCQNLWRQNKPL